MLRSKYDTRRGAWGGKGIIYYIYIYIYFSHASEQSEPSEPNDEAVCPAIHTAHAKPYT